MKSLTVWRGHSTRPSLSAGTARKASGHLSGRRPLHLANARPFGRLKAPLGLSLLRCAAKTRACLWQAEQAHHANNEKQEVPAGELPVVHIAIVCGFWQGASGWTHPVFVFMETHAVPYATSGSFLRTPSAVVSYKIRPANLARTSQFCVPSELFHLPSSASFNTSCPAQTCGNQYPSAGASS